MRNATLLVMLMMLLPAASVAQQPDAGGVPGWDRYEDMDLGERKVERSEEDEAAKALMLRKLVQSATKGTITIQEAPAVITIVTEDDIKDYGFRNIIDVLHFIPGFNSANAQYDNMPLITTNSLSQGVLVLRDGISLFDPVYNIQASLRRWPIEIIKRVETMTSPGGVLWGANSYMGIVSIITKGPGDLEGVEMGLGGGTGPGDENVIRPYVMWGGSLGPVKAFLHGSVEFFQGPNYVYPYVRFYAPPPALPMPVQYLDLEGGRGDLHWNVYGSFDGKIKWGKWTLGWSVPFLGLDAFGFDHYYRPISLMAWPVNGEQAPSVARYNNYPWYERYVYAHYGTDIGTIRMDARGYAMYFRRGVQPGQMIPQVPNVFDGLAIRTSVNAYRTGLNADFKWQVSKRFRTIFGFETFYEWLKDSDITLVAPVGDNGQLRYDQLTLTCPYYDVNGDGMPVYDPRNPDNTTYVPGCRQTYYYDVDRFVVGAFTTGQYRSDSGFILDGGLRIQAAPAGLAKYRPVVIPALSLVVPFWKTWHVKFNYVTGFRPPVFANIAGNNASVLYASNPELKVEKSQAYQVELNSILLRDRGHIQELSFRLDYGFTILDNMIKIAQGAYYNADRFYIHGVEGLLRVYLKGGHNLVVGYTFNRVEAAGEGAGRVFRSVPNQWLFFTTVYRLTRHLDMITAFRLVGSFEDPDHVVPNGSTTSKYSQLAYELVPSTAILNGGFRYKNKLRGKPYEISLMGYNIMNYNGYYTADYFNDLSASMERLPTKGQLFYFFLNTVFRF